MTGGVELRFRPHGMRDRARYGLVGQLLLWRIARALARLPETLSPAERHAAQGRASARLLRHLRVKLERSGLQHARGGPFIVVALHEGIADVLALTQLPLPLRFVARDEIFAWPGVGAAITRLGHLAVNPESGAAGYRLLLREARGILAGGESLALFPQGSVLGIETAFQLGAFALARHLGAPILPVVLSGTHRIWEHPFAPTLRYGVRVGLRVLPPVPALEVLARDPHDLRADLQGRMKRAALGGELPLPRRYVPQRDGFWDGFRFDIDPAFPEVFEAVRQRRRTQGGGAGRPLEREYPV